jgi:lambda family phage minor tail protein L
MLKGRHLVKLNKKHPLTKNCVFLSDLIGTGSFDIVNKDYLIPVGTVDSVVDSIGEAVRFDGTTQSSLQIATPTNQLLTTDTITITVIRRKLDLVDRLCSLFGVADFSVNPVYICGAYTNNMSLGTIDWVFGAHNTQLTATGQVWDNEEDKFIFISGPVKGKQIWRNGVLIASAPASHSTLTSTTLPFNIGSTLETTYDTIYADNEVISYFGVFQEEWTDAECELWYSDPHGLKQLPSTANRFFAASRPSNIEIHIPLIESSNEFFSHECKLSYVASVALFVSENTFFSPSLGIEVPFFVNTSTIYPPALTQADRIFEAPFLESSNIVFAPSVTLGHVAPFLVSENTFYPAVCTHTLNCVAPYVVNTNGFYIITASNVDGSALLRTFYAPFYENTNSFPAPYLYNHNTSYVFTPPVSTSASTISQEGNKLSPNAYVELFIFDASGIGGAGPLYYTNTSTGEGLFGTNIRWKGNEYLPFPFEITGIDNKSDGSAYNRPTITVSNIHKTLMVGVLALGDLIGTKVTRYRTFYKFTDRGSEANSLAHYPIDEYYITRKIIQNKQILQFELSNELDRPNSRLPGRQILRDGGFPGVSRIRFRG